MIEFFIVISFWAPNGALVKQTSHSLPTLDICQSMLKVDLPARIEAHGNGTGYCLTTPAKPAALPEWKKKTESNA